MATSFGAIMASAAEQSRIAREKDEANQLSMMQAGFIPKEQPAQPEPSGLQSMLASVRDQYAYQPEYAPTDYVPGPAHASKMQAAQHEHEAKQQQAGFGHDARNDPYYIANLQAKTAHQNKINGWFDREMASQLAAERASTGLTNAQGRLVSAQTQGQLQENSFDRQMNRLELTSVRSEGEILRDKLKYDKELHPYNLALAKAGVAAKQMQVFKGGSALVTDANGNQHWLEYNPETRQVSSTLWSTKEAPMSEKLSSIRAGFQILGTMNVNSEEYKLLSKRLYTAYTIASLGNDMDSGAAEGVHIGDGSSDRSVEAPEDDATTVREEESFGEAYDEALELTPEEETKRTLRENKPKGVTRKDWDWYVRHYDPEGGKVPRERGAVKKEGDPGYWSEVEKDATMTKKKQERYDSLHRLYKDEVARILGAG